MKKSILNQFFILAIIVGLVSSISSYGQNKNSGEILLNVKGDSHIVSNYQSDNIQILYYDQTTGTVAGTGPASQDFEVAFDAYDNQAADNFTVSGGPWTINQVVVGGAYFNGVGPALNFNVFFYADASGIPGALVTSAIAQPYVYDGTTYFTISLSPAAVLANGNYWISVQCRMDFAVGGQFAWDVVSGAYGSVAQWQNPGGGFAVCPSWGPITTCNGTIQTDLSFSLSNIAGPGLATNPSPANGATGVSAPNATLSWTNPGTQTSVAVYFGTSPGSLASIYSGVPITTIGRTGLSYFTTYYWRVDETNGGGTTTGTVWSFTTMPDPAGITLPYSQTFDGATFPPYWTQQGTEWTVGVSANAGGSPNEMHSAWTSFLGATRLIVGPINTTGMSVLNLAFKHFYDDYGPGLTIKIQSSANLTTWTDESWSYISGGGNLGPETVITSVANNVGTTTYIAWVIDGDHFQYDNWYVDDVSITQAFANDVGTFSIDLAAGIGAGTIAPQATVRNFGSATQTFNVNMTITGGYSSTKTVTGLAGGATQQVTFDNWNATPGSYTVNVCTQLGGDQNTTNDCKSKGVNVFSGSWSSGSNNPDPIYIGGSEGYTTTVLDATLNYFFTMGGGDTATYIAIDDCNRYDVSTNTWVERAPLPAARDRLASALVGDFIYVIGGYDNLGAFQSTVYKYSIAGDSWTTVAPLPSAIGWGKAVGYNNRIYFAGGYDGTNVLSTVLVYDISANTWSPATSMPAARFGGAFSIVGNQLVYVGGADLSVINNNVYVGTISGGDPLSISWVTAESRYPGLDQIALSGDTKMLTELKKETARIKSIGSPELVTYPPGAMFRFNGAPWGTDAIIVAGGSPSATWVAAVPNPCYVYKPASDTWIQQGDVPIPITAAASGTVHDGNTWKLVLSGGINSSGAMALETQIYTDNLGGATTFQLSVTVANAWNMVSIPGLNTPNQNVNTWWAFRDMGANVFKYAGGYQVVTTATPGIGYWMKHSGARTYNTGDEWPAGGIAIVPHDPLTGASGWNLIGGYETSVGTAGLTTVPPGLITFPVYKYSGGYQVATTLDPGYGYWLKMTGAGQIIIPASLSRGNESDEFFNENWGKITITDNAGTSYTLYAVKGEVDLSLYDLPPVPPTGMFDIRYGSGRIAEDLSNSQSIELKSVQYPISVTVENMILTIQDASGTELSSELKPGEKVTINDNSITKLIVLSGGLIAPIEYSLEQNYPNPFNPSTTINFSIPEATDVSLSIYNTLGEKVALLVNSKLEAGRYSYQWDGGNVATGMYIYELRTDKFVSVKKMILLK